ncbi:MAG: hypothetical protein AAFY59_12445 [Pseudomonadota bacterium]
MADGLDDIFTNGSVVRASVAAPVERYAESHVTAPLTPEELERQMREELEAAEKRAAEAAIRKQVQEIELEAGYYIPLGPPISPAELGSFLVSIEDCWGFEASGAGESTPLVVLQFTLDAEGAVDGLVEVLQPSNWRQPGMEQAVTSAMEAIEVCGNKNLILPIEKYGRWQKLRMTFDPETKEVSF